MKKNCLKRPILSHNVLLIFVKYPEPGFVKTRLAKDVGDKNAARLYRLFAEEILNRTKDEKFRRIIFFSPPDKKSEIIDWIGGNWEMCPQAGKDLGERMCSAFRFAFKQGGKKAVIIGTDSPLLDSVTIVKAFVELETNQCVIGPSPDGGYYLLGLSAPHMELFQGVDWSTPKVFSQTVSILNKLGVKFTLLEEHFDVDTVDDLIILKEELRKIDRPDQLPLIEAIDRIHSRKGCNT